MQRHSCFDKFVNTTSLAHVQPYEKSFTYLSIPLPLNAISGLESLVGKPITVLPGHKKTTKNSYIAYHTRLKRNYSTTCEITEVHSQTDLHPHLNICKKRVVNDMNITHIHMCKIIKSFIIIFSCHCFLKFYFLSCLLLVTRCLAYL